MTEESTTPLLLACVQVARDAMGKAAVAEPVFLSAAQKQVVLRELAALEAQVAAARLRVLAVAGDVAEEVGARDVGDWCVHELQVDGRDARADLNLARGLEQRWEHVAAALAEGRCSLPQARVIARALDDLPDDLEPETRAAAETHLVDLAGRFTPRQLRRLGARILAVVDPDRAEDELGKRLLAEEERAARKTSLTISDLGDGTCLLRGRVPHATGTRLKTYLEAFTQPRLAQLTEEGRAVSYDRLLGQAFTQFLERIDPDRLPHHGGDATTVIVTIPIDQLTNDLGTAVIDANANAADGEGGDLSAAEARRLACCAGIIPAVLGTHSEVLDLGRTTRLFTPAQRKALRIKHATCAAEGCSIPNTWTDAHHLDPWAQGGNSDLRNAVLLCGHHHRLAHNPTFTTTRHPDGTIRFHRRT
ncbi:DUF222 domain-containing protein [Nocardioides sp. DS6]|uniref:DUF222 domain-containing protein n=1 Tax=Nocardioides eburneus TaxID=3231482 RepID=A0ABV3T153_9ACTN